MKTTDTRPLHERIVPGASVMLDAYLPERLAERPTESLIRDLEFKSRISDGKNVAAWMVSALRAELERRNG